MNIRRVGAQGIKELQQLRRDKLTMALALVLPLLTLLLMGYGIRLEQKNIRILIRNFDSGFLGRQYADRLVNNEQLNAVRWDGSDLKALEAGVAKAVVIIPPEFSRTVKSGLGGHVGVLIDATDVNNARVIKNSILAGTQFFEQVEGLIPASQPIQTQMRLWFNPGRREALYVVPGAYGLILWIYPSLLAALAMVKEEEQGTILQAYASSITGLEFIAGKVLAYTLVGLMIAVAVLIVSFALFGMYLAEEPLPLIIGSLLYVLSSAAYGVAIGSAVNTQGAAVQAVATTGFTTAMLLAGFIYPVRNIPAPLSWISNILPARYFIELSRNAFLRGSGWQSDWIVPPLLLVAIALSLLWATKNTHNMQIQE